MGGGGQGSADGSGPVAGNAYGSGGGGAVRNGGNVAGAAGAQGVIIVQWFE